MGDYSDTRKKMDLGVSGPSRFEPPGKDLATSSDNPSEGEGATSSNNPSESVNKSDFDGFTEVVSKGAKRKEKLAARVTGQSHRNAMTNVKILADQLTQARNELNNLRKKMQALQGQHRKDLATVRKMLRDGVNQEGSSTTARANFQQTACCQSRHFCGWKPIGHLKTWFHNKNGTPRQGSVSSLSRGVLHIEKYVFNNPHHSVEGLQEYSYVWIFFVFDQNGEGTKGGHSKSKVAPPRLNGERIGVFATRSPHRPNPLGLTLAKLDKVEGNCLHLSGLDILDGTPVIDIKPYIPDYDSPPPLLLERENVISEIIPHVPHCRRDSKEFSNDCGEKLEIPDYVNESDALLRERLPGEQLPSKHTLRRSHEKLICSSSHMDEKDCETLREDITRPKHSAEFSDLATDGVSDSERKTFVDTGTVHTLELSKSCSPSYKVKTAEWLKIPALEVLFNPLAEKEIQNFSADAVEEPYRLSFLKSDRELQLTIETILQEDPRSSYRRRKCSSSLYYFTVDTAHVTVWFDENVAEVLRVRPLSNLEEVES